MGEEEIDLRLARVRGEIHERAAHLRVLASERATKAQNGRLGHRHLFVAHGDRPRRHDPKARAIVPFGSGDRLRDVENADRAQVHGRLEVGRARSRVDSPAIQDRVGLRHVLAELGQGAFELLRSARIDARSGGIAGLAGMDPRHPSAGRLEPLRDALGDAAFVREDDPAAAGSQSHRIGLERPLRPLPLHLVEEPFCRRRGLRRREDLRGHPFDASELVSGGIISLAFQRGKVRTDFLPAAFVTGVIIGAYTVIDGIGVRLAEDSLAYTNAMFLLWSVTMPIIYFALRRKAPAYTRMQTVMALTGGVVSLLAYGIVIWAMKFGTMGVVSALRETSVIYAAFIGRFFLNETLTMHRLASCLAIVSGVACLAV